ncbi:MAG: hypothetical protein RM347_008955 [Nostoc sp. ChiQUE02]|uniref:hypothetical protein n=1 Tax=Nostoc sp. ChiQUE02 TaxID=3075377 RepID=UPI002AD3F819|nr:hypothetical protein [Nostoc sp. ChiQUE02]MDZ8232923.1 hypothetical protein [Nostoc sp. ChiQUE02]
MMTQILPEKYQYPSTNIWFYGNTEPANLVNLSRILELLPSWHEKSVVMRSITAISSDYEIESYSVIPWQVTEENPIEIFQIKNLKILENSLTFDGFQQIHTIKIKAVDFDQVKNQFLIYLADIVKTEEFHTPPRKYLTENIYRYIFTLK